MFKGIYHGKQYHAMDLKSVLERAWHAGVDRIIVSLLFRLSFKNLEDILHMIGN